MREKQHPKATKNTCVVTARLRLRTETSCRNTTDGACPSTAALATYFILKGILFLTQQTQLLLCCKKSPVCFCFVSQFQHLWDTCSSLPGCDTWHVCLGRGQVPMLSRDSPSLKIFAADSRGRSECVVCQVQKFVGAGAGYICGPQLLGYRSLQWVRDTWSGPGGSVNITHVSPIQHSEIKLNVKSFNIISHRIHYADNLVVIQGGVGTSPPQIFRFW